MSLSSLEMSPLASKNAKERRNRRKKKKSSGAEEYGEDQRNPKCDYDDGQRRMVSYGLKRHLFHTAFCWIGQALNRQLKLKLSAVKNNQIFNIITDLQTVCVRTVEGNISPLYFQNELKMPIKHSYKSILFQFFSPFFFASRLPTVWFIFLL